MAEKLGLNLGSPLKPEQSQFTGVLCTVSSEKQNAKNKKKKKIATDFSNIYFTDEMRPKKLQY